MIMNSTTTEYIHEIKCCSFNCLIEKYKCISSDVNTIWLFRGQSNSEWSLLTTLERYLLRYMGSDNKPMNDHEIFT